jgi:hypothetical protein
MANGVVVSDIFDEVKEYVGECDQTKIFQNITSAVEVLAKKNNYDILTGVVDICTTCENGDTVTLPREIDVPICCNVNGSPMFFRNKWFEFHLNGPGTDRQVPWAWDDQGYVVTSMDIILPSTLIAVTDVKTDLTNATIRIQGFDENGKFIKTQEPDGTWLDGFTLPLHLLSDFPFNIITEETTRRFIRYFTPTPVGTLLCNTNHNFVTGAPVILSISTPPLPSPLVNGTTYFVRVIDSDEVSLHSTQSGALTNSGQIFLTSVSSATVIILTDRRDIFVLTKFLAGTAHNQRTGMEITFTGAPMPDPLVSGTTYFTRVLDTTNFTVHASASDAQDNINPIDVSTPGATVVASAKQPIFPITHLDFGVSHNLLTGDPVTIANSSGQLPTPLLPGVTYYVRYVNSRRITLHVNPSDASTGLSPIVLTDSGSGPSSVVKSIPASANSGSANNITAQGHNLTIRPTFAALATATRARASNVATLTFATPHGYSTGDTVAIASVGGSDYNTTKITITVTNTRAFTYTDIGADEGATADTAGRVTKSDSLGDLVQFSTTGVFPSPLTQDTVFRAEPPMSADTFTVYDTSISPVELVTTGSGQLFLLISRTFTVGFTGSFNTNATVITDGTIVKMASTGTLPGCNPAINTSTSYFARKLNDTTINLYETQAKAQDTTVRVSATRARASNVATVTTSAAHGFTTGDFVDISGMDILRNGVLTTVTISSGGTGYTEGETATIVDGSGHTAEGILTVAAGAILFITLTKGGAGFTVAGSLTVTGQSSAANDATVTVATVTNSVSVSDSAYDASHVQITVTGASSFTFTSVGLNEPTTADTGGAIVIANIKVTAFGVGTVSLVFERSVSVVPFSSLLRISSALYLEEGATIQFETNGTLPAPLVAGTDYFLSLSSGFLQVKDNLNNNIVLTNIGSGEHDMVITRNFTTPLPTNFVVNSNNYNNGDAVKAETTRTLPSPLVVNTTYYIRRIDDNTIELYDTQAHAIDTASTTGRISPTNTGQGTHSLVQIVANIKVQKITRISKSITSGFITLYAWDTGRTENLTIIGYYYPDETEPRYRRIKLSSKCAWVRIAFKRNTFKITSLNDFIPLPSRQAILMMCKAISLYKKEFSENAQQYEADALRFLEEAQTSNDGAESITIQFNDDIYTNPDAQGMDTGRGEFWNFQ